MRARASCGSKFAEDRDLAEAGPQQAGQNAQQRGFARAVFAEQHVAAAGLEVDRDLAQRGKGAEELGTPDRAGRRSELASASARVPVIRSVCSRRSGRRVGRLATLAAGCRGGCGLRQSAARAGAGLLRRGGRVLAGALGLQDRGVEDAVAAIGAFGQGLGVVLEGVRRRLGAFVDDLEQAARWRPWASGSQTRSTQRSTWVPSCSMEPGWTKPSTRNWLW